jgi:error-prone DNA polymerase
MSYVELHCHSAYSFLDGSSAPEELAQKAAELGHPALALTDHDGVWGAMEFAEACKALGVRPIVGAEMTVINPATSSATPPRPASPDDRSPPAPSAGSGALPGGRSYSLLPRLRR